MLGKGIGGKIQTYSKVHTRVRRCGNSLMSLVCRNCRCAQAKCLAVKLFSEANTGYFYMFKKNPKAYPWRIGARHYNSP